MNEPVLGIDLGTSNCVLATVVDGVPTLVPTRRGGWLTPSVVAFHEQKFLVGTAALELLQWFPHRVATATKRYLGQRFTPGLAAQSKATRAAQLVRGPSEEIRVALEGCTRPLTQVSALILGELFLDAQKYWGREVRKAVITVPANFDDGQRIYQGSGADRRLRAVENRQRADRRRAAFGPPAGSWARCWLTRRRTST